MRASQRDVNPYPFSDTNKRYQTYEYYLRHKYGGRVATVPLDAGLSCPNIDGTAGCGGCVYCLGGSSSGSPGDSLAAQYEAGVRALSSKWSTERTIAYLQAHTNTYAPADRLRGIYNEALSLPGAVGLHIATRPDCLPGDVLGLLGETARKTSLCVELGLQTVHDSTAGIINRGYETAVFFDAYRRLSETGGIDICVHLIFGLPGEDVELMLESVRRVAELRPFGVKLHTLMALRGTPLADMYAGGKWQPQEQEEYTQTVCRALELLPPETVICRVCSDAPEPVLLAPLWCRRKTAVANAVDRLMFARSTWQGRLF